MFNCYGLCSSRNLLAFFGTVPLTVLVSMIVGQLMTKWILGLIDTPFMYLTKYVYVKNGDE